MYRLLHNIGPKLNANYNTREEILNCNDILTFDGVYKNVYENRDILKGKEVILFVMGNYVGKDNSFDIGMPREEYCTWDEIAELVQQGCKLGWHTWSHRNLKDLTLKEKIKEMTPPYPMDYFAYPYGDYDEESLQIAQQIYKQAFSVTKGECEHTIKRFYL